MSFFFFCFFLVVGLSVVKSELLKLIIVLEFIYMVTIFFFIEMMSLTLDMLLCIMIFSAGESVLALCLVMVFSKFFQKMDSTYHSFF